MPLKGKAKSVMASMRKTYGKDAEKVFYATANKQDRKPETWKKEAAATPVDIVEFYLRRAAKPKVQNKLGSARHTLRHLLQKRASITLDIEEGDTLLFGRYKNNPHVVKEIGADENGQPTINGMKLLACRIKKKMPK